MEKDENMKQFYDYHILLEQVNSFSEKQELLVSLESQEIVRGFGCSETNCVDLIGRMELPNVTKLAAGLHMTRGAISKITKRLMKKGIVTSYMLETNRKEIYFELTEQGWELFEAHRVRHQIWENRELQFFRSVEPETLEVVSAFFDRYNQFLQMKIEVLEEDRESDL